MSVEYDQRYEQKSIPKQVLLKVKGSVLLSIAAFGLSLVGLAVLFQLIQKPIWAGIIAASGLVVFTINLVFYAGYKVLEKRY